MIGQLILDAAGGSACASLFFRAPAACWCARATVEPTDTSR